VSDVAQIESGVVKVANQQVHVDAMRLLVPPPEG
jgi:hypothetical protein